MRFDVRLNEALNRRNDNEILYKLYEDLFIKTMSLLDKTLLEDVDVNDIQDAIRSYAIAWVRHELDKTEGKMSYVMLMQPIQTAVNEANKTDRHSTPIFQLANDGQLTTMIVNALTRLNSELKMLANKQHAGALRLMQILPPADYDKIDAVVRTKVGQRV